MQMQHLASILLDNTQRLRSIALSSLLFGIDQNTDTGIEIEAIVQPEMFGKVKAYIPGYVEPKEDWEE